MAFTQFKWLRPNEWTRGTLNIPRQFLEHDHVYEKADFPAAVVAEWINTGAAQNVLEEQWPPEEMELEPVLEIKPKVIKKPKPKP